MFSTHFTERSSPSGSALRFVKYKPILMICILYVIFVLIRWYDYLDFFEYWVVLMMGVTVTVVIRIYSYSSDTFVMTKNHFHSSNKNRH